jgi:hypothetical protein
VPLETSYRYLDTYGNKARLQVIKGADHTFNSREWEEEVLESTVEFFQSQKV